MTIGTRRPIRALALPTHCYPEVHKGYEYIYVRIGNGKRVRLHAMPGTEAFTAEYARAIETLKGPVGIGRGLAGSIRALATRYLASDAFRALSANQQERYRKRIERFATANGHRAVETLDGNYFRAALAELASVHERNLWQYALVGMFRWGAEQHPPLVRQNPFLGIKADKTAESKPHRRWLPGHVAAFRSAHATGTIERRAFEFIMCTLARGRSDVSRMTRHNVQGGVVSFTAAKNGEAMEGLPISPWLKAELAAVPATELIFFRGRDGRPMSGDAFGKMFKAACKAAGLDDDLTPHGIRHAGACEAAERGESVLTIQRMLGDRKIEAALVYVQQAETVRMRREAHLRAWGTQA
jgi:integrase